MKFQAFIWSFLLIIPFCVRATDPVSPVPLKGVLDLRKEALDKHVLFNLNGEWEFYWETLLSPENFNPAKKEHTPIIVNVPSYFSNYRVNEKKLPGMGYGTYALTILMPPDNQSAICFDIPLFDVAYKFYLNDILVNTNGTVGTSRDTEEPWYEPSSFCFVPRGDTLQLLIQVSNFHHRRGGFWQTIYMGGSHKILERMERRRMYNYSTIGILFFFTFFFIIFWLFSKQRSLMLIFALTALGILIRSVNTGLYFSNSFVTAPWTWQIRMEYLGSYIGFIFGMIFLHRIFPRRYMNQVIRANTLLFSLASVSLFILPVHLFAYEMLVYQPLLLLFLVHYLILGFIGTLKRRFTDAIFFVSLALFIYTLVNDILLANTAGASYSNYLSQVSFQLFVFAMAVLIIMQWVKNYDERFRLESALRFKNKVLSVIAHDLKNPVASVAQFSDLLASKPELSGKKAILNSLQESSQAAVTLLDNLLYWGRSQADELHVTPVEFDTIKLISEVQSLYLYMATQKELKFNTDLSPQLNVYADRALVNIVVRNLTSNAIKFTPREGTVTIRARQAGNKAEISVIDTGVGINPDILDQFQAQGGLNSSAGTESEIGTGLGLQLVKDLVQRNGGELRIESKPKQGSTFTFTLPIAT